MSDVYFGHSVAFHPDGTTNGAARRPRSSSTWNTAGLAVAGIPSGRASKTGSRSPAPPYFKVSGRSSPVDSRRSTSAICCSIVSRALRIASSNRSQDRSEVAGRGPVVIVEKSLVGVGGRVVAVGAVALAVVEGGIDASAGGAAAVGRDGGATDVIVYPPSPPHAPSAATATTRATGARERPVWRARDAHGNPRRGCTTASLPRGIVIVPAHSPHADPASIPRTVAVSSMPVR